MTTDKEYSNLGQSCRTALDGNFVVGSFAADLVGESYPFSKEMCAIVFKTYTDADLGKKFEQWMTNVKSSTKPT